jgi:hypothetical protein
MTYIKKIEKMELCSSLNSKIPVLLLLLGYFDISKQVIYYCILV